LEKEAKADETRRGLDNPRRIFRGTTMSEKILFVDDEQNVLDAYQRTLRKDFHIETALSGAEGLEALASRGPYAVIVSDMRMPVMDGVEFLARARQQASESVRIMLTGNADQQTAIDAVNEGSIFRFLTKPCAPETLAKVITAGLEQHRLVVAERELLEQTLSACIQTLTDLLSLINPTAFSCATRVRRLASQMAAVLKVENAWQVEIAAMLSQVGCVVIPEDILHRVNRGQPLNADEMKMMHSNPQIGYDLIRQIPRLEKVAEIIAYQDKLFNGDGWPRDDLRGDAIPLGSRILRLALDLDRLTESRLGYLDALKKIRERNGWYDPDVVHALEMVLSEDIRYESIHVRIKDMSPEMILAEDIVSTKGLLLIPKGQEVTLSLCMRMTNFHKGGAITEPIKVLVPVRSDS
jgi:response regulator RpfG family c-di-GMP phosphodiesterase